MSKERARKLSQRYEKVAHPILYFEYGQFFRLIGMAVVVAILWIVVTLIRKFDNSKLGDKFFKRYKK